MTKLLASVRSAVEAHAAVLGGADIVDLKEPAAGALGRLPDETIRAILAAVEGRRPTSATIGDMALAPTPVRVAVMQMADTGVDIVKLGIFAGDAAATIAALAGPAGSGVRLVAVLFADRAPDFGVVERCADAGFYGVMLDTADKRSGRLTTCLPPPAIQTFVARARASGLLCGLAGSLTAADVADLVPLAPDYLGFRSALTKGGRAAELDGAAVGRMRALLDQAASNKTATATAGAQSAAMAAIEGSAAVTMSAKLR